MTLIQLIDFTAGIICGVLCARAYYRTKARRRLRHCYLRRRVRILNRDRL